MSDAADGTTLPPKRRRIVWKIALVLLVLMTLANCLGISMPPVVLLFYLMTGWTGYLGRVTPQVYVSGWGLLTAVACIAGVVVVGHATAAWVYRETARTAG